MIFVVFYLSTLPIILFSGQSIFLLLTSFVLGLLLYVLFTKPKSYQLLIFLMVLAVSLFIIKPRLGLDMGLLNAINSQRGEHPDFAGNFVAKLIHNKTELSYSFIENFDKLLSPAAIFASGFWHKIGSFYPLGYLFPWDIYFIYSYFKHNKHKISYSYLPFLISLSSLLLLTGFIYVDQAMLYSFGVIFFLALLSAQGYYSSSRKTTIFFAILNVLYLLYHLRVTTYFPI
ncbi:MAG: hypothetical protein ACD_61C00071G0008 [uncultured bacterium]|nr:MAG: hypothetical protein ACD_61C00071G0008 [uncultured bacterium]